MTHHLAAGFKSTEFYVTVTVLLIVIGFLYAGFFLADHDKNVVAYGSYGAVITGVAGFVCHSYNSGRVRLKERSCEDHHE